MSVLGAVLTAIKTRSLDKYFELEQNVAKETKQQILAHLKEDKENPGQPEDKLRLFIIWFLSLSPEQDVSRAEWTQFEEALSAAGADTGCLPYIRQ
jgi:sec1 family domain-containing protein 1